MSMEQYRPGNPRITTNFGHDVYPAGLKESGYRFHRAIDVAGGDHTILTPFDCDRAIIETDSPSYGSLTRMFFNHNELRIAHIAVWDENFLTLVKNKLQISETTKIGVEGNLGLSAGSHTHTELVSIGGRNEEWDKILQADGKDPFKVYTDDELKKDLGVNYNSCKEWLLKNGIKEIGPHICWGWDRRNNCNSFWYSTMDVFEF